ncbi:MAG: DegT/DnrJ/EryC1/StrS family aminotransferase, partial [Candidatus Eiseniibacteriota bacterium]
MMANHRRRDEPGEPAAVQAPDGATLAAAGAMPVAAAGGGDPCSNGAGATATGKGTWLVPPVGYPLERHEWFGGLRGILSTTRTRRRARRALADYLGVRRVWLTSSGRAALTVALRVLAASTPARRQVVVPAYTCYSVASAIVRAGLEMRLADYRPDSFEIDPDSLANACDAMTLAVVATHLCGLPMDLAPFHAATAASGALLVDDAAQALGARRGGRPCGAAGDLGILSFGRGKPLTTLGGGALLADSTELVQRIEPEASRLTPPAAGSSVRAAAQAALYTTLLNPSVYWLPSRLPCLKIGETEFEPGFTIGAMPAFKFGLLRATLGRLDAVNELRRRSAERLRLALSGIPGIRLIETPSQTHASYLRFPVLVEEAACRAPLI